MDGHVDRLSGGSRGPSIRNPILRGFNPDPSIVRVGADYFIATSTFEWFPGVRIHHSRDLVHWRLATRALTRAEQLDLRGDPPSGGVYAPDLSHRDGRFYLVYSDVKGRGETFMDVHNFLVTATSIDGPWSDRIGLNSSGFDPSLFHDEDGRSWLVNPIRDYRPGRPSIKGIAIQEYSIDQGRLVGPASLIYAGTGRPWVEGPHLYRHGEFYYLVTAEGGTGYEHAMIVNRSRSLTGPYEEDPSGPVLTATGDPALALQRAGHASLVETADGWYIAHLCSRPVRGLAYSPLGRETALQRVEWMGDGWLRLTGGGHAPLALVDAPDLPVTRWPTRPDLDDFDSPVLDAEFDALRVPIDETWLSLTKRPGWLRLRGRESLSSRHEQSLIARRVTAFRWSAWTHIEFAPVDFQQMAGLICYYDSGNYLYLRIAFDEDAGICLGVVHMTRGAYRLAYGEEPMPPGLRGAFLRVVADADAVRFSRSWDGEEWQDVGPPFDPAQLSDEYVADSLAFTGTYVGLCAQDLSGAGAEADFDQFSYSVEGDGS